MVKLSYFQCKMCQWIGENMWIFSICDFQRFINQRFSLDDSFSFSYLENRKTPNLSCSIVECNITIWCVTESLQMSETEFIWHYFTNILDNDCLLGKYVIVFLNHMKTNQTEWRRKNKIRGISDWAKRTNEWKKKEKGRTKQFCIQIQRRIDCERLRAV